MPHPLDGPLMKLERAREHALAYERESKAWIERSNPYTATVETDASARRHVFRLHVKDAPPRLSLIFGDAVGNLRASLDHLVHQLAIRYCPGTPPHRRTSFPIEINPGNYPSVARDRLRSVMPEAWEIFECLQQYHRTDWSELYYLWLISELCNADKHRVLSIVGTRGHITTTLGGDIWLSGALEDRQEIHIQYEVPKPGYYVQLGGIAGVLIEGEAVSGAGLIAFHDFIRDSVFPLFAGFFEERRVFQPLPRHPRKGRRAKRSRAKRRP